MLKKLLFLCLFFICSSPSYAQLDISATGTDFTIDFDNSVSGVNNGSFNGSGFTTAPTPGQLDSDAWALNGLSDGNLNFSASQTSGDFARGASTGGVSTGGIYAFTVGSGNNAFGFQAGSSDFAPGEIILRIENNTGATLENLSISYNILEYNDDDRSNSLNFAYSSDNINYTSLAALDFVSEELQDASPAWSSYNRNTSINGMGLTPGSYFYLRWSSNDVSGSGSRDELAIDNIVISGSYVNAPSNAQINAYSSDRMNISWTKPTGTHGTDWDGVLAFISDGPHGIDLSASGLDGIDYTADTVYSQGTFATDANSNDNAYCVANLTSDTDGNIDITGLSAGTNYNVYLYAYKETVGNNDDDDFSSEVSGGSQTVNLEAVTNLSATPTNGKVILNWNNNGFSNPEYWEEVVVVAREGSPVEASVSPAQLSGISTSTFTANSNWNTRGNSNDIYDASSNAVGTDNTNYIVYAGTANSASITGLTNGTTYHFRVFTFFSLDNNRWSNGTDASGTPANTAAPFVQQDFETTPATPELQFTGNGSYSTGNGVGPSDPKYVSGSRGYEFNNIGSGEILCNTVDATQLSNIEFTFRLAAFSSSATSGGLDGGDYVYVDVSTDGGTSWSEELEISGNNNSRWSFTSGTGTASTPYDGDNSPSTLAPAGGGARTTDGYSTVTVTSLPSSPQLRIRIRFDNDDLSEFWVVDDLAINAIETRPQIVLSDNGTQVTTGSVNQAAINHILSQTEISVTDADATVTSFIVEAAGTYTAGSNSDIANFKLRYSTDATLDAGDATLDQENAIPASGNNLEFNGLSQLITAGNSGYFFVTADIEAAATPSNTVGVLTPNFTFSGVNDINGNTMSDGGLQTIQSTSPAATLTDNGAAIAAGTIDQNEVNHVIATFQLSASNANISFQGLDLPTGGSYTSSDIDQLQLWHSSDNTFDANSDQVISTISSVSGSSPEVFSFSGVNQHVILSGNTSYFFITADLNCTTNISNSISVGAIATSDLTFGGSPTLYGGPTSASGTQDFDEATPNTISSLNLTPLNQSVIVEWTDPSSGCFDDFLLVVHTSAISGSPVGSYTVNSQDYLDVNNSNFPGGGKTVYQGNTSPQTITGLTNGTNYFFKVFARNGATWETVGLEESSTPIQPPSSSDLLISAVYDGVRSGQTPKGIELYALNNIEDLSFYSVGSANNGDGSDGPEYQLASVSLNAGEYYYLASETVQFNAFFGFNPNETNGTVFNLNGDDAIELFLDASKSFSGSETVVDVFGEITYTTQGSWSYLDGWAARNNATGPDGSGWDINNWRFGNLTGGTTAVNSSEPTPIPVAHYSEIPGFVLKSNGNWSPENPAGVTSTSDDITLQASESFTGDVSCNNLTIESGNSLTVSANNSVTIAGGVTNNGSVIIENNASLVQTSSGNNNSGSGTYEVNRTSSPLVDATRYNFWSSPVTSTTLSAAFPNSNTADFYTYNSGAWATASGTMTPGRGYTATGDPNADYSSPQTFDIQFNGTVNNGDIPVSSLSGTYVMLGNPYPSGLDADELIDNTNITSLHFWNHNTATNYLQQNGNDANDYAEYTLTGGVGTGQGTPDRYIGAGQGFMAQFSTNPGNITFQNAWRSADNDAFYSPTQNNEKVRTWLNLSNDQGGFNQILIGLFDNTTDEYDENYDGKRLKANSSLSFYSKLNAEDYSIQALSKPTVNNKKVVELGVDAWDLGEYTIALDSLDHWPNDYSLVLVDIQENVEIDLLSDSTYTFEVSQAGTIAQRFYLNIERIIEENNGSNGDDPFTDPSTSVDDLQADLENLKVYQVQDLLWIDAVNTELYIEQVELITVKGQTIRTERFESGNRRQSIPTAELAQGIYFVRISAANGATINHKVFIK